MTEFPINHYTCDNVSGGYVIDEKGVANLTLTGRTQVTGWDGYAISGGTTGAGYLLCWSSDRAFKAVSMRIKRLNLANYANIVQDNAGTHLIAIKTSGTGNFIYAYNNGPQNNSNLTITDTIWHHLMIVEGANSSSHWFWLDGVKANAEVSTGLAGVFRYFGRSSYVAGQENVVVDNIQIYDRIPTDAEIAWLAAQISQAQTLPIPVDGAELFSHLSQPYSLWPDAFQVAIEQTYSIAADLNVSLEQLYSIVLEIWLTQHYGDVPVIGKSLVQPYGNGSVLIRSLQQRWDHAPELEVSLEQPWSLPDLLQAVSLQSYGIVAEILHLTCEQLYHINEHTTLFASLLQPYIIAEETARLYQFDTRLYIDGERIPYHSLEWQAVDSEFVWSCDFSVKTREVAAKCVDGAEITIVSTGDTWRLKCYDGWFLDKRFQSTVYRISGRSRSWDLSLATPLLGDIAGGMASEIVAALAAPHGIAVDWRMVDGYIAGGKITANDQTPIEIIKDIVHDAGGIVLSTIDGNLLIVAEEDIPVPEWPAAVPAQTIHAVLERISTSESKDEQKGYNCFDVSDQLASGETFRFEEERIDGRTKELRLFLVPMDADRRFVITHSSDNQVTVEPFGIVSLQINDELVEFRDGSGRTSKPVYGLSSVVWQKENLGGVSFSEDGILTSTVSGYSLLKVSYVTKYFKWIARDLRIEDVQFRAAEVTA